jgi:3-oxoacyl-[acyl-carrier protein] reductase
MLIVGSRMGLGRALAEHYLESGHKVFGLSRGVSDLSHANYRHLQADVKEERTIQQAFALLSEESQTLDVLIYCAGIVRPNFALLTAPSDVADILQTNLFGAFVVTRHALRLMKRGGFGRLIYLTSIAVPLGSPGSSMYGASKAGLEQLAFALAHEFPADNITFNALGISIYASSMLDKLGKGALEQARAGLVKSESLTIEEVAEAIDFFASDAARQITGQTIYFGGVR